MRAAELHRLARLLRAIALEATRDSGDSPVTGGRLAVLEDVARHPGGTIGEITERTGLAQSLVSRIVGAMSDAGALVVRPDAADRRRVRVELEESTRRLILERADAGIESALAAATPALSAVERAELAAHLDAAADLLHRGEPERGAAP